MSDQPVPAYRFAVVAALLAGLCLVSFGIEWLKRAPDSGQDQLTETVQYLQERLDQMRVDAQTTAEVMAEDPRVVEALSDSLPSSVRTQELFDLVERVRSPHTSVELYDDGELIAWNGFGIDAPVDMEDPASSVRVVSDASGRRALVVTRSVNHNGGQLGTAVVTRMLQVPVPVRNQYLQNYDVVDEWQSDEYPPFSVYFGSEGPDSSGDSPYALVADDGTALGFVNLRSESAQQSGDRATRSYRSIALFWFLLLLCWLGGGLSFLVVRRAHARYGDLHQPRPGGVLLHLFAWVIFVVAARQALIPLEIPHLWFEGDTPLANLFNPAVLASSFGNGWMGTTADLWISACTFGLLGAGFLFVALYVIECARQANWKPSVGWRVVLSVFLVGFSFLAVYGLVNGARFSVLDSTVSFFDQTNVPSADIPRLVVLALILATCATVGICASALLIASAVWNLPIQSVAQGWKVLLGLFCVLIAGLHLTTEAGETPVWYVVLLIVLLSALLAFYLAGREDRWSALLTVRGLLVSILFVVPITYLLVLPADRERTDSVMIEAADEFARGQDRRLVFAIEEVLSETTSEAAMPVLRQAISARDSINQQGEQADSAGAGLTAYLSNVISGSLLGSLSDYTAGISLFDVNADSVGGYAAPVPPDEEVGRLVRAGKDDPIGFDRLKERYDEENLYEFYVARTPVARHRGTYRYAGIGPVRNEAGEAVAWIHVRATPRLRRYVAETPFPRVLVPSGFFGADDEAFSYAEYDNGVLVRTRGGEEGPSRLSQEVREVFSENRLTYWHYEELGGQPYRAYYRRFPTEEKREPLDAVVVRVRTDTLYDHLFNLLRFTLAALVLGLIVLLLGIPLRYKMGLFPARTTHFRDKLTSGFLVVGATTIILTAIIGQQVIEDQQRRGVRDLLIQRLQRVQASITEPVGPDTPVEQVLRGSRADMASTQLGLDVHVYEGAHLVSTSRPQLVRQQLIEDRLPPEIYTALFIQGRRYAFAEQQIGSFSYTTGFRVIADESGVPIGAVAVPTLPEQASIEAGQARMTAYLFGILLVLLVGIGVGAALLANQLTRPLSRLRKGLVAVGAGKISEPLPVETRDELGELAETFNQMQAMLEDSRRQLAQQERELAWREMAQQVAHEIKNPLTPMKLSIQHLRRSYPEENGSDKFGKSLDRIATTLVEQIDALSRIAGDFSSFASLPVRKPEHADLHEVIREAAELFANESEREEEIEFAFKADKSVVLADREETRRVFINLFKNALQAVPRDRDPVIGVETSLADNHIHCAISDNGAGISEELRERIFQPNFSTKSSGMGLGLAIVRKAVEATGGSISFTTETGVGTTFSITFPLASENSAE